MQWEYQEKVIGADITGPGPENMVQFALDFQGRDLDSPTVLLGFIEEAGLLLLHKILYSGDRGGLFAIWQ